MSASQVQGQCPCHQDGLPAAKPPNLKQVLIALVLALPLLTLLWRLHLFLQQLQLHSQARTIMQSQYQDIPDESITTWEQLLQLSSIKWDPLFEQLGQFRQRQAMGLGKDALLDSYLEYLGLEESPQFRRFRDNYDRLLPHKILEFSYNASLQQPVPQPPGDYPFSSMAQLETYLLGLIPSPLPPTHRDLQAQLAYCLLFHNSPLILHAEYHYATGKYNLNAIKQQSPICIISTGYNLYSRDRYRYFFDSLQQQNYSNYQVIVVDDNSPDNSAEHYYQYLQQSSYKLKNRVKIIKMGVNLGALGNMYIWVRRLCKQGSIVVNVDTDDGLIGRQVLRVLNRLYKDPEVWYVYTRYLHGLKKTATIQKNTQAGTAETTGTRNVTGGQFNESQIVLQSSFSFPITYSLKRYRYVLGWVSSHLRTYRQHLMANMPVQAYLEYRFDPATGHMRPAFHTSSADRYQVYAHLEQCANNSRVRFITDVTYAYVEAAKNEVGCYRELELYEEMKSRAKKGEGVPVPAYVKESLRLYYQQYQKCVERQKKQKEATNKNSKK